MPWMLIEDIDLSTIDLTHFYTFEPITLPLVCFKEER
jgi:hypothetical protein